jgi:hypothetical protein
MFLLFFFLESRNDRWGGVMTELNRDDAVLTVMLRHFEAHLLADALNI